jgi:hypothetical protein
MLLEFFESIPGPLPIPDTVKPAATDCPVVYGLTLPVLPFMGLENNSCASSLKKLVKQKNTIRKDDKYTFTTTHLYQNRFKPKINFKGKH